MLRTEGTIYEITCPQCGFKEMPGSFSEDKGSFRCPICNEIAVTMDDIVQVALKMDSENGRRNNESISSN